MHKDGIKSRVTTLIHRPLTRSASPSIWQYFCNITVAPGAAYWSSKSFLITFNAQLVNVFGISFPCASHHPAALCMFRSYLLLSVIAVAVCNCLHMSIIIKVVFGNVNVKFAFPVTSPSQNGWKTPELQLWGFCSFASIVDTNHIIFAYRRYSICSFIMQYYNNIIIITAWSAFLPRSGISQPLLSSSDAPWTRYRKMRLIPKCSTYRLEQLRSPFRKFR